MNIFERIGTCFRRLVISADVPPTSAMTDKMVEITVGVLDILAIATMEINVRQRGKFTPCITIIEADCDPERSSRVAGRTNLEDRLENLDKLTEEAARLASAEVNVKRQ